MISVEEAHNLVHDTSNYSHAVLTGKIMRILAGMFEENLVEWEITGILHDIDIDIVRGDMAKHGLVSAEILEGKIPDHCIYAIKSHDHRTGFEPKALIDKGLIFADIVSHVYKEHHSLSNETLNIVRKTKPRFSEVIMKFSSQNLVHLHLLETLIRTE
jgi:predicted hydrolase (HD superfamily)